MERGRRNVSDYLTSKFKGKYRLLPELCLDTQDFPRNEKGEIDEDVEIYISCRHGNKISYWGLNSSRRGVLIAYIPSVGRGRNIKKELQKQKIEIFNYDESAEEVLFHFLASDIEPVAKLMGAKTSGANISPLSNKNLPKSDVEIPMDKMEAYKKITSRIEKKDLLLIKNINSAFLTNILEKSLKKQLKDKQFDYKQDMRNYKMSRQVKEYILTRGFWEQYLEYLDKEIETFYSNK